MQENKIEHFRLPKSILTHEIFSRKKQMELRLFLLIVGNACYKEGVQVGKTGIVLSKGQWLRSQRKLQGDLEISPTSISKAIKWLCSQKLINVEHTQQGTIFTVYNFDVFQGVTASVTPKQFGVSASVTLEAGCYSECNAGCYSQCNETNKENNTNKKELYNLTSINNIKGSKHNERDISNFEWEKYQFKF